MRKVMGPAASSAAASSGAPDAASAGDDRLKAINDELRGQDLGEAGPWLPLESNPEIFTSFGRRVGLPEPWEFRDLWCLDLDSLAEIPAPVAAVILLFPCTQGIYADRAAEGRRLQAEVRAAGGLGGPAAAAYHLEQVASFGNACGTIAAVHALTNADVTGGGANGGVGGPIAAFRAETVGQTAAERGKALLTTSHLKQESDGAAEHAAAQTSCPSRDGPDLDHHYCAFVPIAADGAVHVVELDGTKFAPVDHGPIEGGSSGFLQAVAGVVQRRWMSLEPGRVDFSLMALCRPDE